MGAVEHVKLPRVPDQWHAKKKHCLKGFEIRVVHLSRVENSGVKLTIFKKTTGAESVEWPKRIAAS